MHRRELFRILGAGAVVPALTPQLFAFARQAQPASGYALRTLSAHQNATVVAMIDQIIPETDTLGAKAVRVNEFIDVILTEWATPEERSHFLAGLDDVDQQSSNLFGKNFTDATSPQQMALLAAMDDALSTERGQRPHHGSAEPDERDTQLQGKFWEIFKNITLHGYYTSEIGFTQELKEQIIPGALHGCAPIPAEKKA